jgi:hypothetical protein
VVWSSKLAIAVRNDWAWGLPWMREWDVGAGLMTGFWCLARNQTV